MEIQKTSNSQSNLEKEEVKLSLFAEDLIQFIETLKILSENY